MKISPFVGLLVVPCLTAFRTLPPCGADRLVVIMRPAPDCKCVYNVEQGFGGGNNACVTVNFNIIPQAPPPTCFIQELCGPAKDCSGQFSLGVIINNWANCCPGGTTNMNTCVNGSVHTTIPSGFGGSNPHTLGGTKLACQATADSFEIDASADVLKVVCGNDCTAGVMWLGEYKEQCLHCPAGG